MDILTGPDAAANNPAALRAGVDSLQHPDAKTVLTAVLQNPQFKTDQQRLASLVRTEHEPRLGMV